MKRVNLFMGGIFTAVGIVFIAVGLLTALLLRVPVLLFFTLFGLPFLLLGIGFLRRDHRERYTETWLRENGSRIYADFVAVQFNTSVRVNGRCPLVIQCQAVNPADGKVYVFESDSLWFDPTPFLDGQTTMPVLVDPDDYHRYQMLTAGILPEKG